MSKVESAEASGAQTIWQTEIAFWCVAMRAAQLSSQTIALRRYHVRRLARDSKSTPSPWSLTASDLLTWAGSHAWGRETARAVRSSLRRFWNWGVSTGRTDVDAAAALPQIRPSNERPRPAEVRAVEIAMQRSDRRVAMMIRLANELGLRRGEVAQVKPIDDLVRDATGWSLVVHGKGAKNRALPVTETLAQHLRDMADGDYLFPGPTDGHLSAHWVGTLVSRALADGTTMHQLRHLCATEVHEQTHDLRLVQTLLGHASVATTQRYVAVDDTTMREALQTRSHRWQRE